jgi:hypothetical protein
LNSEGEDKPKERDRRPQYPPFLPFSPRKSPLVTK